VAPVKRTEDGDLHGSLLPSRRECYGDLPSAPCTRLPPSRAWRAAIETAPRGVGRSTLYRRYARVLRSRRLRHRGRGAVGAHLTTPSHSDSQVTSLKKYPQTVFTVTGEIPLSQWQILGSPRSTPFRQHALKSRFRVPIIKSFELRLLLRRSPPSIFVHGIRRDRGINPRHDKD
jgi:hypothetical protein